MKRRWSKTRLWNLETGGTCSSASASRNASTLDTRSISHVEEAPLHHQPLHHQAARVHMSPPSQICTLAVFVGHNVSWSLGPWVLGSLDTGSLLFCFLTLHFPIPKAKAKSKRHKQKQKQAGISESKIKQAEAKAEANTNRARGHKQKQKQGGTSKRTHRSKHKQTHREKQGSTGNTKAPKH